jgi:hypothetical protein
MRAHFRPPALDFLFLPFFAALVLGGFATVRADDAALGPVETASLDPAPRHTGIVAPTEKIAAPAEAVSGPAGKERAWFEDAPNATSLSWLSPAPNDPLPKNLVGRTLLVTAGFAIIGMVIASAAHIFGSKRPSVRGKKTSSMALVDTLTLAPRCSLQLVSIDSQRFLVARDASGVRSVTPVTRFDDAMAAEDEEETTETYSPRKVWDTGLSLEKEDKSSLARTSRLRKADTWQVKTAKR